MEVTIMASLTFQNLNKIYPNGFVSVKDFSLHIEDKELVAFHGPHGCGKSTILRMIGGLEDLSSGEIYLGDTLLNDVYPRDRQLAMLFQNYRLYGHLNVYDNIALGLRIRSLPKNVIDSRVNVAAKFLGISKILEQKIKNISELEKQCVGFARALVCKPKVLLIDEEFAHQDEVLHERMITDMLRINRDLGITTLFVTNDYDSAVRCGQRVVLMKDGEITDIMTP
jgi:multiple sugar transport system ATP-binding protein